MIDPELVTRKVALIGGDLEEIRKLAAPRDYYDGFTALGKLGVLEAVFATRIAAAVGLRNRIVHEYEEIEPAKVFEGMQATLADLPIYLKAVLSHTGKRVD